LADVFVAGYFGSDDNRGHSVVQEQLPLSTAAGDRPLGFASTRRFVVLEEMFKLQAELNMKIGIDTSSLKTDFDTAKAGAWLNDYIAAASSELEELRDCTFWKHWCAEAKDGRRYELHDLQNARVEVIDLLFFWISMAQCVGLDAKDVHDIYMQKLQVNHDRQANQYGMLNKDESDNKDIKLKRES
jgi:dimeric dUTPase (all-alpha-NTP-PPase superfamily)